MAPENSTEESVDGYIITVTKNGESKVFDVRADAFLELTNIRQDPETEFTFSINTYLDEGGAFARQYGPVVCELTNSTCKFFIH